MMSETSYINKIKNLEDPTFQKIRRIANDSISHLSDEQRNELYNNLKRGVKILETHEELCQYLWSFGNMHEKKIHYVVDKLPVELFQNEYDIVDWGCGQGIATSCFFDYLKEHNYPIKVNNVKLIFYSSSVKTGLQPRWIHKIALNFSEMWCQRNKNSS